MSKLAAWLAGRVKMRLAESAPPGAEQGESRLIFHGPPLEILSAVYEALGSEAAALGVPVLLQVDKLSPGVSNPSIGASGPCDETHLLDLRNSPQTSSYLALVPPGQRAIRSVSSTTDEFGLGTASDGANVPFDDWWTDPFIQGAIAAAIGASGLPVGSHGDAGELVQRAARAYDEVDVEKSSRRGAWRLISRLFAVPVSGVAPARAISLACGVPPMKDDRLSVGEQHASLDGIASALSEGFRAGLAGALDAATPDQRTWLDSFLDHIRATCDVPTCKFARNSDPLRGDFRVQS
jgi:DNA phosphorothioation-dependent restriction protein DptH